MSHMQTALPATTPRAPDIPVPQQREDPAPHGPLRQAAGRGRALPTFPHHQNKSETG